MKPMPGYHPLRALLVTPFQDLHDAPTWGKAWGIIAGGLQWCAADLFTGILVLVFISGAVDYLYGRRIAKLQGTFDSLKADFGLHSKILSIILLFIVRAFEFWLSQLEILDLGWTITTHGLLAVGLAVILLAKELDSIDHHRQTLGGEPWPVFDQLLGLMRKFPVGKLGGGDPPK